MKRNFLPVALGAALGLAAASAASATTLEDIQARGKLNCGVNTGLAGFLYVDDSGERQGFDAAYCRALAAAVLGDANAVEFTPLTSKNRFSALASGEIDVLSRNTTWTFQRDADLKNTFIGVSYYDGQGFLVPKSLGVESALELDGATICIQTGTTTELNVAEFFESNDINFEPLPIETFTEAQQNYLAGACDVYTTDASGLAATRATFENPEEHLVLPEIISKEPLGPLVRQGDEQWADIARWTLNALIIAEEKGITKENAAEVAQSSKDPEVKRLLGTDGDYGAMVGLNNDFALKAIQAGGNYGEIFEQYLGENTALGLARGLNAQWKDGGLIFAPPFR
ncbi:amino acid ABC transporter substrate-binding protein [Flexibacterium corallicola]|uniref:amino acid ABC transporter substrate-binding protein n=1 Tax=Flexibacterium corallicola TaxID=3037259 RepID=UPI00286EEDA4|nr:amino acid ABC transporter substrate-binding protein [Pseudovibrio sp. M1P-2-3]